MATIRTSDSQSIYDLKYPGAAIDAILDTAYDLQNAGYIFRGLASEYSNTPTERSWVLAGEGETGHGFTSPIPKGYIGVCVFNGTSWTGKLLKCVSIDSTPTPGSTNAVSSGGAYAALNQLATGVAEALDNMTFTDVTPPADEYTQLKLKLATTDSGIERIITYLTFLSATTSKAGLLSAADKAKLDAILTNLRSLEIEDTTAYADLGDKIVESIKATIGGTEETISTFQILAATAEKAGLLSAADKAKLDALWSSGYQFAGIATPSTTPVSTTSKIFYIATEAGTYFNTVTVTQGINIIYKSGDAWSVAQVVGIDNEPTAGSNRLVKSGGVFGELALGAVYDVSAKNPTAGPNSDGKWESLSALLSDANLNTLIPTSVRKGGMSIKYVQSSDNKYVQYFLTKDEWSLSEADWQNMNLEEEVSQLGQDIKELFSEVSVYEPTWEIGNIAISSTGWSYGSSTTRVRLKQGTTLHLYPGDIAGLTDYSGKTYYIGWRKADGTYEYNNGWLTKDFHVEQEGEYVFLLRYEPEVIVSSVSELGELFFIKSLKQRITETNTRIDSIGPHNVEQDIMLNGVVSGSGAIPAFEFGTISFSNNDFVFSVNDNHIRTIQGHPIHLYRNDIVSIESPSTNEFALFYTLLNGNKGKYAFRNSDVTISVEGYYHIVIRKASNAKPDNIMDLINPFKIIRFGTGYGLGFTRMIFGIAGRYGSGYINYNTLTKKLFIPRDTVALYRGISQSSNNQDYKQLNQSAIVELDLSSIDSSAISIVYDSSDGQIKALAYSTRLSIYQYYIAGIRDAGLNSTITSLFPWSINGNPYNIVPTEIIKRGYVMGINHKGYNTIAPENTLPAFKLSAKNNFKWVETDIHCTSDDVPVLLHDNTINRTARNMDGSVIENSVFINNITYNEALGYDFGIWKGEEYAGTPIPTFEQLLILCRNTGMGIFAEVKVGESSRISKLVKLARQYNMLKHIVWIATTAAILGRIQNYDANANLAYIVDSIDEDAIAAISSYKNDNNVVYLDSNSYTAEEIALCKEANIPLLVWTINNAATIAALPDYVGGVTSDDQDASRIIYERNLV